MIRIDLSPRPKKSRTLRWGFALTAIGLLAAYQGHAVLGGRPTMPGEFPAVFGYEASLRDSGASVFSGATRANCTAFLVHPKLLLTAAHCVKDALSVNSAANGAEFGGKKTERGISVKISEFKSHPDFVDMTPTATTDEKVKSSQNDIAYLVLREAVTQVAPYALYISSGNQKMLRLQSLEATVVGYGATKWNETGNYSTSSSGTKHTGTKPITRLSWGYFYLDGEKHSPLPGDSGGPVLVGAGSELRVAGIVHGGFNGTKIVVNKRGKEKKVATSGAVIATMLTPKLLCWVEKESKIDLPEVECEVDGTPKPIPEDTSVVVTPGTPAIITSGTPVSTPSPSPRN